MGSSADPTSCKETSVTKIEQSIGISDPANNCDYSLLNAATSSYKQGLNQATAPE